MLAERAALRRLATAGGGDREAYVAIFCPHCGEHINEVDEQDAAEERDPDWGTPYNCGWCGLRTSDWNHVVVCRRTHKARAALAEKQRLAEESATYRRSQQRLRKMLDELSD
jgi:predicted RNA-binding Zn-ribbon protein involved in translation (DUF1610 family)